MAKLLGKEIDKKNLMLLISIPAIVGLGSIIVLSILDVMTSDQAPVPPPQVGRRFIVSTYPRTIPSEVFWLFSLLAFIGIVPFTYYFISKKLEDKIDKNMKLLSKVVSKNSNSGNNNSKDADYRNIFLKFLNFNERKVLEKLIEGKGRELQAKISRMDGMNKLKTHRAVRDLERKGIIKTEIFGKTKLIILTKDIKDAFIS